MSDTEKYINACRICFSKKDYMKSIFESIQVETLRMSFGEMLEECASVNVLTNDNLILTKVLCKECTDTLEANYNFRLKCITSSRLLDEYFQKNQIIVKIKLEDASQAEYTGIKAEKIDQFDDDISIKTEKNKNNQIDSFLTNLNNTKKYQCQKCKITFNRKDNLKKHMNKLHKKQQLFESEKITSKFKCQDCSETFTRKGSLAKHLQRSHQNEKDSDSDYQLADVDYAENSTSEYQSSENEIDLQSNQLEKQQKLQTRTKFECDQCSSTFTRKDNLTKHIKLKHKNMTKQKMESNNENLDLDLVSAELTYTQEEAKNHTVECPSPTRSYKTVKELENQYTEKVLTNEVSRKFRCQECGSLFTKKHFLLRHMRKIHKTILDTVDNKIIANMRSSKKFKCSKCTLSFVFKYTLYKHMRKRHGKQLTDTEIGVNKLDATNISENQFQLLYTQDQLTKKFVCQLCESTFATKSGLKKHMKSFHINLSKQNRTDVLEKQIEEKSILKTDPPESEQVITESIQSTEIFSCDHCDSTFTLSKNLRSHIRKYHTVSDEKQFEATEKTEISVNNFICKICNKVFCSKPGLTTHLNKVHSIYSLKCKLCLKVFSSSAALETHKDKHQYHCKWCLTDLQSEDKFEEHKVKHNEQTGYICNLCEKTFSRSPHLRAHLRLHKGEKPHLCTYCGKAFAESGNLTSHVRIHTGEKPYRCELCGSRFTQYNSLRSHLITHRQERIHLCTICGRSFVRKAHLRSHLNIHTDQKTIPCEICGTLLKTKESLRQHEKFHRGEKKFECGICEKSFYRSYHLKVHQRVHSGEKPYGCTECGKSFVQRYILNNHIKSVHQKN